MTETAPITEAPSPQELSEPTRISEEIKSSFHDAMEKHGIKLANDGAIPLHPNENPPADVAIKTKVLESEAPNGTHPIKDGDEFPSELIEGIRKEVAPVEDADALFKEQPKGPVKHEHFERVQKTALERVTAADAKVKALEAELAKKLTTPNPLSEEHTKALEDLKSERATLLEKLGIADYANTPEFHSKFTAKERSIEAALMDTAEAAGADKDMISALLHVPIKKRMAMLDEAELSPSARGRIEAWLVRHDELQSDKASELANWKTNAAARQQQEAARAQAHEAQEEREYDLEFEMVSKELFEAEPFRLVEGQPEWNKVAERNRANARELLKGQLSKKAVVVGSIHAAGYETLLGMLRKVQAVAKERGERLSKYEKNTAIAASGSAPRNDGSPDLSKMTDDQASRYQFNRAMGRAG